MFQLTTLSVKQLKKSITQSGTNTEGKKQAQFEHEHIWTQQRSQHLCVCCIVFVVLCCVVLCCVCVCVCVCVCMHEQVHVSAWGCALQSQVSQIHNDQKKPI